LRFDEVADRRILGGAQLAVGQPPARVLAARAQQLGRPDEAADVLGPKRWVHGVGQKSKRHQKERRQTYMTSERDHVHPVSVARRRRRTGAPSCKCTANSAITGRSS